MEVTVVGDSREGPRHARTKEHWRGGTRDRTHDIEMKSFPTFEHERRLWNQGYDLVIGIDEVGRGCLAGPLVVVAVAIARHHAPLFLNCGIDDSKRLRPHQRSVLDRHLRQHVHSHAITTINVATINRLGMTQATQKAMRQAVKQLKVTAKAFALVDAFHIRYLTGFGKNRQRGIIRGDQQSIAIAGASIIAKVYRDRLMKRLGVKYHVYGWGRNKGYGTKEHQEAIRNYGITRHHRRAFVQSLRTPNSG